MNDSKYKQLLKKQNIRVHLKMNVKLVRVTQGENVYLHI